MNWLRTFSVLPSKLPRTNPANEWEEVYFTPAEMVKASAALRTNKKVWLVPVQHYLPTQYMGIFKMLEDYEGDTARVRLNLPWRDVGTWCGCSGPCEAQEKRIAEKFTVTRQLV